MNTEENQGTIAEEEFEFPLHPLFSFQDDEFLGAIVKRISPLSSPMYRPEFAELMDHLVFNDDDVAELQQMSFYESTVCSKSLSSNELYFVCLDCDLATHPNIYTLLCFECFEKSNHKGHRLLIMKAETNSSGNCDCGDAQHLNPEGFCSDHKSKPINLQELYENFPRELRFKFETLTKKSIYGVVSLFELENYPELADDLMSNMLNFWIECYSEVNRAFLPILWTTLIGHFESPWDLVWHNCEDLKAENRYSQEAHKCTCSLLGHLLKISNLVSTENQGKLGKILLECVKDQDFLEHLAVEFTKYIHYFFSQNYDQEISEDDLNDDSSLVPRLYHHVYTNDKCLEKVLDCGYFENFVTLIGKVVNGCTRMSPTVSLFFWRMRSILDNCLVPSSMSAEGFARNERFMLQYLDEVMTYQMKFYYAEKLSTNLFDHQINYDSLNLILRNERNFCRPFENLIALIEKLPQPEQKSRLGRLLQSWYLSLQNAKAALVEEDGKPSQSFDPCLERLFCCIIINYMKEDISPNNLKSFLEGNFACVQEVGRNVIEGPLRALGMIRYIHLTFNYRSGKIFNAYYFLYNAFFETDVVTAQMMVLLLKPEEGLLFELLTENFFSYSAEIQGFFQDPNEENFEKKKLTVIEDFLYFLAFLMKDEICLFNVQSKYKTDNFCQIKLNQRQRQVAKNLLVNILRGMYWTTGKEVTNISHRFLVADQEIDQILTEITVKDETNQKIRIKDEYEAGFDPYIFYRLPSVRQDMIATFTAKNSHKNNSTVDLVSGGEIDKDMPLYLQDIQTKLYQSNLPEFLCKYLKMVNLKANPILIPIVLKLILLNLEVAKHSDLLREKIKNNYENEDFLILLENISMEESLKDYKSAVENIKKLLQNSQGDKIMLVENSPRAKEQEESPNKKLTAQERMERLKQAFAQKQAAFAQKNESMFEDSEGSKKVDDDLFCQHCLEKLQASSSKEYGLLININFTNNFYDRTADNSFDEQDYKNLLKADWWPVISSCHHYYHRKCFEVFYKAPRDFEKNFFSNNYEFFCPLCKSLCNNFLSVNGEGKESDEMNQEASEDQLRMYPQIYQTFTKKIQKLLVDLKARIQLSPAGHATALEEASFVSVEVIFERAYQYFIESYYTCENAKNLRKSFELYAAFFRGFRSYFRDPENKPPEDNLHISAFFNVTNLFLSTQATCPSNFLNYKTEVYLTELLAKNLQRILAKSDDAPGQAELFVLKDYILLKIAQIVAFNNYKLEDCLELYKSNQAMKASILNELVFPTKKIVLSYALNNSLNSAEIFQLLYSEPESNNQEVYLTDLFKAAQIPYSFSELILEIFQELPTRPQSETDYLNSLFDHELFNKDILKPQKVKFAPRMIKLPENFLEFNTHYFHQKCNLCNEYSPHLFTSICLICGEILCTSYCNDDANQAGNLNRHSKKYHMGMGAFLGMQRLSKSFVNTPLNVNYRGKSLYLNAIGQDIVSFLDENNPIHIARLNFAEFNLNQEYTRELMGIINQQALRKEVFTVCLKIRNKSRDNFF